MHTLLESASEKCVVSTKNHVFSYENGEFIFPADKFSGKFCTH